jgi:hypothetical protein
MRLTVEREKHSRREKVLESAQTRVQLIDEGSGFENKLNLVYSTTRAWSELDSWWGDVDRATFDSAPNAYD